MHMLMKAAATRLAMHLSAVMLCFSGTTTAAQENQSTSTVRFFESRIRPVLVQHCYECHSASGVSEGGLQVDSKAALRKGGSRGPAIVPGDPKASLLLRALSHVDDDLKMPPNRGRLPAEVIADFEDWIAAGAPDPRVTPDSSNVIRRAKAEEFWALQPPARTVPPDVSNKNIATTIDRFVAHKLETSGLKFSPVADRDALLRRLHFDLTGLPPSLADLADWQQHLETRGLDAAIESRVDQLLSESTYGERWGRHWLDVARFAESSGKEANISYPYAWRYRDYVIDCFNADIPYDQFIIEQIAGDLLPYTDENERTRLLIATGFLAVGTRNLDAMDEEQFAADIVDEQIDSVSRVFMASSIACARCHDHKFDPYSMTDYYALAGIFRSTKTYFGTAVSPANRNGGDPLVLPRLPTTPVLHRSISAAEVEKLKAERAGLQRERFEKGAAFTLRDALRVLWRTGAIDGQLEKVDSAGKALPLAMGVLEQNEMVEARLLTRGDIHRTGDTVARGFPSAIRLSDKAEIPEDQSGRLQLAKWLTNRYHPLTARVAVNRIWAHFFGRGIVHSVDDFGSTGRKPSHPELLDHLAIEFIQDGWSIKRLIRRIVTTRIYQQSTQFNETAFLADPKNALLWRMPERRLEAEAIRDAMLVASGELKQERPVASLVGRVIGDRPISLVGLDKRLPTDLDGSLHRSVYLPIMRDRLPDVLEVFDFAEPGLVTGRRDTTNVPTQALYLMNSPFVSDRAAAFAKRIESASDSDADRVKLAFRICFARTATESEIARSLAFLQSGSEENHQQTRLNQFCQALFSTLEFRMLN